MSSWLHCCCGQWEGWALVNRFNHTNWVDVACHLCNCLYYNQYFYHAMYNWLHYFCGEWEGWAIVNRFNHTSGVTAFTPTDRLKSVRNRCYRSFWWLFYVVTLLFGFFCGYCGFCHGTESDLFLFLLSPRNIWRFSNFLNWINMDVLQLNHMGRNTYFGELLSVVYFLFKFQI